MSSVEFAELTELQQADRWDDVSSLLVAEPPAGSRPPGRTCC